MHDRQLSDDRLVSTWAVQQALNRLFAQQIFMRLGNGRCETSP